MSRIIHEVPIVVDGKIKHHLVPARTSGVPGLLVTAYTYRYYGKQVVSDTEWVLTHRASGFTFPGYHTFPSIAAARRAAKRIAAFADWTKPKVKLMGEDLADTATQQRLMAAYRGETE